MPTPTLPPLSDVRERGLQALVHYPSAGEVLSTPPHKRDEAMRTMLLDSAALWQAGWDAESIAKHIHRSTATVLRWAAKDRQLFPSRRVKVREVDIFMCADRWAKGMSAKEISEDLNGALNSTRYTEGWVNIVIHRNRSRFPWRRTDKLPAEETNPS